MSFIDELKRRNVIRVGIAYAVAAWFLLQISDLVLENIAAPDWVMQVIMLVLGIGFPLVIIFAWAFEMTPEGIKREKDVDRTSSITHVTGRKLDRMIIGVLVVTVGYLLVDKLVLQKTPEAVAPIQTAEQTAPVAEDDVSVAVLPFVNMSGDQENEYFSDGLTETLLHMLAQLPELRVAARTSSFAFKGQNKNVTEIAKELNVANILEGSVQKANNQIRVTAQLIDASDGSHIWSQNYTRPLEDIFAIQDEIAADVSDALGASLLADSGSSGGVHTTDLNAFDSYLKGLEQQAIFSYGSLEIAESHFERALTQDPSFTDARLSLVRNYLLKHSTGLIQTPEARAAIQPLIRITRETDPDNMLAGALELTMELQAFDGPMTAEERTAIINQLRDMLHLMPSETYIRSRVAATLRFLSRDYRTATEILQAGLMFDPLSDMLHAELGDVYLAQDRPDDARNAYERAIEIAPENPNHYAEMSELELRGDNLVLALDWSRRATLVDPNDHEHAYYMAKWLLELELIEEGNRWTNRVNALAPGSGIARSLEVQTAFYKGEHELTMQLAEKAISDRIDNRQDAYNDAVRAYILSAEQLGQQRQAFDFLQSEFPQLLDYGVIQEDPRSGFAQFSSFSLRASFESTAQLAEDWIAMHRKWEKVGFNWREDEDHGLWTMDLMIQGRTEEAIEHYVEHRVPKPLATNLQRFKRTRQAIFAPVYSDLRVAAALDDEAERWTVLRDEVREMLQGDEWQ
jgi:TolB-like protein